MSQEQGARRVLLWDLPTRIFHWALGSLLAAAVVGFWTWGTTAGTDPLIAGTHAEAGQAEHGGAGHEEDDD